MLIVGLHLLVGLACGLRLTLLAFIVVMLVVLGAAALALASTASLIASFADVALAWLCLQAGYVAGIFVRSLSD